jgi:drug/metabolite transporter (DMT)-like permease
VAGFVVGGAHRRADRLASRLGPLTPLIRGALLIMLSATLVAVDTVIARIVTQDVNSLVLVFFRNLFGVIFLLPLVLRAGLRSFTTRRPWGHFLRAAIKIAALIAFYYGVSQIPVAEATAIAFATPLFIAAGAALFLGESLRHGRLLAILVGFAGVLVILRPGVAVIHPAALAVVASTVGLAAIALLMKVLTRTEPPNTIAVINITLSAPLALIPALFLWTTPSWQSLGLMLVQGALGTVSQLAVTRAVYVSDVSLIMPIDFVRLPIVAGLGFLVLGQVPDRWMWIGAAIICLAILLLLRSGRRPTT